MFLVSEEIIMRKSARQDESRIMIKRRKEETYE
jgi:hypothetical protein